ncbi:MAG: spore germination protein [Firmicutes bacterium]|nr:spore germination protein [Bacillota bacterium]
MPFLEDLKQFLLFQEPRQQHPFELLDAPSEGAVNADASEPGNAGPGSGGQASGRKQRKKRAPRKPQQQQPGGSGPQEAGGGGGEGQSSGGPKSAGTGTPAGDEPQAGTRGTDSESPDGSGGPGGGTGSGKSKDIPPPSEVEVSQRLEENLDYLKGLFNWPRDQGFIVREFTLGTEPGAKAAAIYLEGLTDSQRQALDIFKPLMLEASSVPLKSSGTLLSALEKQLIPSNSVIIIDKMTDVVENICSGSTVLFFQGVPQALSVETSGWSHRGVEQPTTERVVRGSQEAFNEDLMSNVSLLRRLIRDPKLNKESLVVGRRTRSEVAIMYISDIASTRLVDEVRRRIQSLEIEGILGMGELQQLIDDESRSIYPLSESSERPDRVSHALLEGRVAVLIEGDPFVATYPSTVWGLLQTSEDYNVRGIPASMLRIIRWLSALVVILLPGFYLGVVGFHHEMIPTDLLMSIAAARERVPFPSVVEVVLMEVSFELIREGGIRIPGIIGPTLGIVGAIILGQAAVAANIVSPIVIIIVAMTGIASFAIPSYTLSLALRVWRFAYIAAASVLGLYGMGILLAMQLMLTSSFKSFGVPYLSPMSPVTRRNPDILFRGEIWDLEERPDFLQPQDKYVQPPISRRWILNPRQKGGGSS